MKLFDAEHYIGKASDISLSRRTITKNFGVHWHDFFEIEIILGGKGIHNLNGTLYNLEEGYVYMLTPTDYHNLTPSDQVEIFNVMFNETLLSDEFLSVLSYRKDNVIYKFDKKEFEEIKALCFVLEKEYTKKGEFCHNYIKNIVECIMMHILNKIQYEEKQNPKSSSQIQKAIQHINIHFKDNPSLTETASLININPNYFSQKFREETGKSYVSYLTERKLKYAKRLLKSGEFSITEICFASGFNSVSNFLRVFKEKTGKSPSQYIKNKGC